MSEESSTETKVETPSEPAEPFLTRVFLTGATGFVGGHVLRDLVARGHKVVCLVRDRQRFMNSLRNVPTDRIETVVGDLFDDAALTEGTKGAEAVVHLVGIIAEDPLKGQTFERIHTEATGRVINAAKAADVKRYVHMSALGTRVNAVSEYHRTKWAAENLVRTSGLDWTIFRPSLIHGPDGEFMQMLKTFVCDAIVPAFGFLPSPFPVIPYFGDGRNRIQPVSVKDVAHCFASALSKPETTGKVFELGGARAITWRELYQTCRELIPNSKSWKPMVGMPVPVAKLMAATVMKLPILPKSLRFNAGQVQMSQEDSVCDVRPAEEAFGIRMRDFRTELTAYADLL